MKTNHQTPPEATDLGPGIPSGGYISDLTSMFIFNDDDKYFAIVSGSDLYITNMSEYQKMINYSYLFLYRRVGV